MIDTEALEPLRIDIFSDVMCPWCFIGKKRLDKALSNIDDIAVRVAWHPFQLDATLPPEGKDRRTYLEEKFGGPEQAAAIYSRIEAAGAEEDIDFAFDKIAKSPNTLNAHRVIHWAGIEGVQHDLVERLFEVFFLEGGDLGNLDVLADAAGAAGMDPAVVRQLLGSDADKSETEAAVRHANLIGVTGVPCFILNGKVAVPGAQPADVLETAIRKVAADRSQDEKVAAQPATPR